MNENPSSPKVALLAYYTTETKVIIFLIRKDLKSPMLFQTEFDQKSYATNEYLSLCTQRLMIDFNGLSPIWEKSLAEDQRKRILSCLELKPQVLPRRRYPDPNYPGQLLEESDYKFELTYLETLSNLVFPRNLKDNLNDCDLLCIAPHGSLHSIPFHALKWTDNMYVIEKFGISYTPSASTLRYCQAKNKARINSLNYKPVNCIVVCSGTADDYKKFEEDIDILNKFHWNSITPLKGGTSVKSNVERRVVNNDIIHFACHGLFAMDEDPLDSGLLLTPEEGPVQRLSQVFNSTPENRLKYFLTAREIFKFKSLNCNLVTLRACSSGRFEVRRGDELIGLTRAFLYAGAPSLLVSLWNVNINSSRILFSRIL